MAPSLTARAESARQALFQRYDQLNALWTQAEEKLTRLHIPCGVECIYKSWQGGTEYEPNPYDSHACLGLQKVAGKWRICHGYCDDARPWVDSWTPIVECSAEVRTEAARHLPKLREAVVKAAEDFIPKVDKAIEELQAALSSEGNLKDLLTERAKLNGKAK